MSSRLGATSSSGRRGVWARVERFLLGIAMGIAAFLIERRLLRSVRRTGASPWSAPDAATLESGSGEGVVKVELERDSAPGR